MYPWPESRSKTRTLRQKVDVEALHHLGHQNVEALHHLGHQNASKTCTLSEKVCQKHVPFVQKSVGADGFQGERQKHVPLGKKCVKNAYP